MSGTNGNGTSSNLAFDEGTCERYIFGELTKSEQEHFETSYFNDDSFFNRFLAVKDELLDLYSRNELDVEKRRRLEAHFQLTAARRKRLAESQTFIRSVTQIADRSTPGVIAPTAPGSKSATPFETLKRLFTLPKFAVVGGLLVLIAVSFWILRRSDVNERVVGSDDKTPSPASVEPESEVASQHTEPNENSATLPTVNAEQSPQPKRAADDLETAVNRALPSTLDGVAPPSTQSPDPSTTQVDPRDPPQPTVAQVPKLPEPSPEITGDRTESVTLSSQSRSVSKGNTATIGTATQSVVIRMLFGSEAYASYSVRVSTLGGQTVWRASNLKTGGKALAVTVPAGSLSRKDYIVTLEGRSSDGKPETIREYYLHVDRQ